MVLRYSILSILALFLVSVDASAATPAKLRVDADAMYTGVALKVSVAANKKLRSKKLAFYRAQGDGKFVRAFTIVNPGPGVELIDFLSNADFYSYRVKLSGRLRSKKVGVTSKEVAVYFEPPDSNPSEPGGGSDSPPPAITLGAGESRCPAEFAQQTLDLVNVARASEGLQPLALHAQLNWASEFHSDWMIQQRDFSHTNWFEEILNSGFQGSTYGQNIAHFFPTPASVVEAWLNSPGHRANIMKTNFTKMGISCIEDPLDHSYWWTQDFGG
jgi:uncharacterized protein YkwD